jgi:hypothetical protein
MYLTSIRKHPLTRRVTDLTMKIVPIAGLVTIAGYMVAQQAVSPQRRAVKAGIFLLLLALMMRCDMVWSIYLFTILFPFPSGISIGSTNSILMTIIPMVWAIRAASTKTKFFLRKTRLDFAIAFYLFAHAISMFNLDATSDLEGNLEVIWRTLAAVMYFYMIVMFVDTEQKILTIMKISCGVCAFVMVTGIFELFYPGASIIPGWMSTTQRLGTGELSYRIEGMRVGGVFQSQVLLADYGARMFVMMIYLVIRERNYFQRFLWAIVLLLTILALVATANRGAAIGITIGLVYGYWLFRQRISLTKVLATAAFLVLLFAVAEVVLTRHTHAVSLSQRLMASHIEGGFMPDNRKGTWIPTFNRAMERPWFGHGPKYELSRGLVKAYWPHNGYLYYFHTLGVFGLIAFLVVVAIVWRESRQFKHWKPGEYQLADIGRILHLTLVIFLFQQIRTDHQRNDIYIYLVWGLFAVIVISATLMREKLEEEREKRSRERHETDKSPGDAVT